MSQIQTNISRKDRCKDFSKSNRANLKMIRYYNQMGFTTSQNYFNAQKLINAIHHTNKFQKFTDHHNSPKNAFDKILKLSTS